MHIFLKAFLVLVVFFWLGSSPVDAASLTLAWEPPTDTHTVGYIVRCGDTSGKYSNWFDVGSANSHRIQGLTPGKKYFFTVQAYSESGKRSDLAPEIEGEPTDDRDSDRHDSDKDDKDDDDIGCDRGGGGGGGGGDDDDEPPVPDAEEVVIYASDVTTRGGGWQHVTDGTAADRTLLHHPNSGFNRPPEALRYPRHYFEAEFNARKDIQYRVWVRMRARGDAKSNDSVFVQFSDTVAKDGRAVYRIGSTSSIVEELRQCGNCENSGWGWTRRAYWREDTGIVRFKKEGVHTIRIQTREDGVDIDQIVISPYEFRQRAPGSQKDDDTIVPKPKKGERSGSASPGDVEASTAAEDTADADTSEPSPDGPSTGLEWTETFDAPITPSAVSTTLLPNGDLDIAWAPSQETAAVYRVEVGAASGATAYSTYTTDSGAPFDTTGLAASTYYVRVRAVSNAGLSEPSNEVTATAPGAAPLKALAERSEGQCAARPNVPRQFSAFADGSTVHLRWEAGPGPLPTGYVLEVESADGVWTALTEPIGVTNGMTATAAEGTYVLRLTARNHCGPSRWGVETTIDVGTPARVPGPPK